MNFVPTTQKASLRTGGYSQFVPFTTQFGNMILMFEKDLKKLLLWPFGLWERTHGRCPNNTTEIAPLCYGELVEVQI